MAAKRLVSKVGTYQKDGQDKGEYVKIGVVLEKDGREFMLLDPCVNLAGVLAKQNAMAAINGQPARDSVMVSIFEDQPQQNDRGGNWGTPSQPNNGQPYNQPQNQPQQQWGNPPQNNGEPQF